MEIPQRIQQRLAEYQQIQQQIQMVATQRAQLTLQMNDIENTLEALDRADKNAPIYQNVGAILIRVDNIEELKNELKDEKEILEVKIKSLERQENQLKERYMLLQREINEALRTHGAGG